MKEYHHIAKKYHHIMINYHHIKKKISSYKEFVYIRQLWHSIHFYVCVIRSMVITVHWTLIPVNFRVILPVYTSKGNFVGVIRCMYISWWINLCIFLRNCWILVLNIFYLGKHYERSMYISWWINLCIFLRNYWILV
jgi:hypothetical protein